MLSHHLYVLHDCVSRVRSEDGSLHMHASLAELLDRALRTCINAAKALEGEEAVQLARLTANQLAGSNIVLFQPSSLRRRSDEHPSGHGGAA